MREVIEDKHIHDGHRSRMKAKLVAHGQRIFDTYELLEMLLYLVIPFKDTNPVAKRMLAAFGSLDGVLRAEREELLEINGVGERVCDLILALSELGDIIGGEIVPPESVMNSYRRVGERLLEHYKGRSDYSVALMMFDNNMNLIATKDVVSADYNSSAVHPALFVDMAVRHKAAAVITAHNHPFGPSFPCPGDRATNSMLKEAFDFVGIPMLEHFLISGESYYGISENKLPLVKQTPAICSFFNDKRTGGTACGGGRSGRKYSDAYIDIFAKLLSFTARGFDGEGAAHALLSRYLTIENAMCADIDDLTALVGSNAAIVLKIYAYLLSRRVTDSFELGNYYSPAQIADYLKGLYIGESVEKIYAIIFDGNRRVKSCEFISEGTIVSSEVVPRKLLQLAISSNAAYIAIAHNHPMGSCTPSNDDMQMTLNLEAVMRTSGMVLTDHFIVSGQTAEIISCAVV